MELEAVLRVSSHLQQFMHDLSEFSEESVSPGPESALSMLTGIRTIRHNLSTLESRQKRQGSPDGAFPDFTFALSSSEDVVAALDYRLDDDTGADVNKQIHTWSFDQTVDSLNEEDVEKKAESQQNCQHEAVSPSETKWLQSVSRIGDEAAGVGYTLIGCAREEMSRLTGQRLEASVKNYLRKGVKHETGVTLDLQLLIKISVVNSVWEKFKIPTSVSSLIAVRCGRF